MFNPFSVILTFLCHLSRPFITLEAEDVGATDVRDVNQSWKEKEVVLCRERSEIVTYDAQTNVSIRLGYRPQIQTSDRVIDPKPRRQITLSTPNLDIRSRKATLNKSLFTVQRVAKITANRAAAIFIFFFS